MKHLLFKSGMPPMGMALVAIALALNVANCAPQKNTTEIAPVPEAAVRDPNNAIIAAPVIPETEASAMQSAGAVKPSPRLVTAPPASEVVPSPAKEAAATLVDVPLALAVQPYSSDELFAEGGGGCGMSLWRAEGSYSDSSVLFSGIGEGPQLLIKLDGQFVGFERMEGRGQEFYGQFTQQRFRNLNGDIEVMTEVELGEPGEIESVEIPQGRVVVTRNGVSQEIAVQGDAGC